MLVRLCSFCQAQALMLFFAHLLHFATAIGTTVGIASTIFNLVLLISNGITKLFLKTMRKKKTEKLLYWLE